MENRLYTFMSILIKSSDFKGRVKKSLLFYLKVSTLGHIPFLAVLDAKMFGAFFKSKCHSWIGIQFSFDMCRHSCPEKELILKKINFSSLPSVCQLCLFLIRKNRWLGPPPNLTSQIWTSDQLKCFDEKCFWEAMTPPFFRHLCVSNHFPTAVCHQRGPHPHRQD